MSETFWRDQTVIVTGGAGFLGRHVVEELTARSVGRVIVPRSACYDLREQSAVARLYIDHPETTMVIHLAANVGGIGINREHPGLFFYENLMMGTLMLEYARRAKIAKFVGIGTVCSYPKFAPVPFREGDLWRATRKRPTLLRLGKENAAGAKPGLSSGIRLQRHPFAAGQPIRTARQI